MTFSAHAGRPLFVPAGIAVVRTGPTTRAEFERLLDDDEHQHSGIRRTRQTRQSSRSRDRLRGVLRVMANALHMTLRTLGSQRPFESR